MCVSLCRYKIHVVGEQAHAAGGNCDKDSYNLYIYQHERSACIENASNPLFRAAVDAAVCISEILVVTRNFYRSISGIFIILKHKNSR